jgi:hypothetical protein
MSSQSTSGGYIPTYLPDGTTINEAIITESAVTATEVVTPLVTGEANTDMIFTVTGADMNFNIESGVATSLLQCGFDLGNATATNGHGTSFYVTTGEGLEAGDGGDVNFFCSDGGLTGGDGGNFELACGDGNGTNGDGGYYELICGNAVTDGVGGYMYTEMGSTTSGQGGYWELYTGDSLDGSGGFIDWRLGDGATTGDGGYFEVSLGDGGPTAGAGGGFDFTAGAGGTTGGIGGFFDFAAGSGGTNANGGFIRLAAGTGGNTTGDGGDIFLYPGNGGSSGSDGQVRVQHSVLMENKTTVTQLTSITTAVAITDSIGTITTVANPNIATGATAKFSVTSTGLGFSLTTSTIMVTASYDTGNNGVAYAYLASTGVDTFEIAIQNTAAATIDSAIAINYWVV